MLAGVPPGRGRLVSVVAAEGLGEPGTFLTLDNDAVCRVRHDFSIARGALAGPGALSRSRNILKGIFFSERWVSTMGLTYSVNHIVNRHAVAQAWLCHL